MQVIGMFNQHGQQNAPQHTAQQLNRIAAWWTGWADAQPAAVQQYAAAHSALTALPTTVTLPPDLTLALMMRSITDAGGGSVQELLESDTCDTELDDHLATVTSEEDDLGSLMRTRVPAHSAPAGRMHAGPGAMQMIAGQLQVVGAAVDTPMFDGMYGDRPAADAADVPEEAWQPLGASAEVQLAAEVAMGALMGAHAAAAAAFAAAAAAVCVDGAVEDVAAVTAAVFECGWAAPDMLQAAREAASSLLCVAEPWDSCRRGATAATPGGSVQGRGVDLLWDSFPSSAPR